MAFIPAPDVVRVFWEHELSGNAGKGWVSHFELTMGTMDVATIEGLADHLVTWWDVHAQPLMCNTVRLQRLILRDLSTQDSFVVEYDTGLPLVGTRAGAVMPSNIAFSVKLNTGITGRSNRGRMYWFGMGEADVFEDELGTSYTNAVLAACNQLTGPIDIDTDQWGWVVLSQFTGNQPRAQGVARLINNVTAVDRRVDTQRRRLPRGG